MDAASSAINQARLGGYMQGQLGQSSQLVVGSDGGAALPRDPRQFVTGAFGPLSPILPMPIDVPDEETGRAEPRRWQYPVGWNLPVGVPGSEGLKLVPFASLRSLAESYSVARSCITLRQNEILGMEWDIGPTQEAEKRMHNDADAYREFNERRAQLISFFRRPDPNYHDFHGWLRAVLEEMFVTDATSVYLHPSRKAGKGVCGSNLAALDVLDGTTIRPLIDLRGGTPAPPNAAYQCLSVDTEILTRRGWLRYRDLADTDEFATRSPDGAFEWQRSLARTVQPYDGEMVWFHGRSMDCLVTPNHRVLWAKSGRNDSVEHISRADEVEAWHLGTRISRTKKTRRNPTIVMTSTWDAPDVDEVVIAPQSRAGRGPAPRSITMTGDQYAAFLGMWISEGCLARGKNDWRVIVSQTRKGKGYQAYEDLLRDIFGRVPGKSGDSWAVSSRALYEHLSLLGHSAHTKRLPDLLLNTSRRQLEIFWHYYWLGDGSSEGGESQTSYTVSEVLAGQLQEVLQKIGFHSSVRFVKRETPHGISAGYKIRVRRTARTEANVSRVPYVGNVWCVQVPNGTLYVRRNGHPCWTGNSYLWGVPRVDLMDVILDADIEGMKDAQVAEYRADQLLYLRYYPRSFSPYGFSPTEQAIVPIMAGLAKQQYTVEWFTQGSVPATYMDPGPDIVTPTQIASLQRAMNSIAGDIGFKHKIIVTPHGAKPTPMKPTALADDFDQLVMEWVLMCYDVQPFELGIIMTRAQGAATQFTPQGVTGAAIEASNQAMQRKATKPLLMFLKRSVFDLVIRDICHCEDMEWKWHGLQDNPMGANPEGKARQYQTLISTGAMSVDEVREEIGLTPWGEVATSVPVFTTKDGPIPWELYEGGGTGLEHTAALTEEASARAHEDEERTREMEEADAAARSERMGLSSPDTKPSNPRNHEAGPEGTGTISHRTARVPRNSDRAPRKSLTPRVTFSPTAYNNMLAEMDKLKRVVKRGRPLSSFTPDAIPSPIWESMLTKAAEDPLAGDWAAIEHGLSLAAGWVHLTRRDSAIELLMSAITIPIGVYLRKHLRGKITADEFIKRCLDAVSAALYDIALAAAQDIVLTTEVGRDGLSASEQARWDDTIKAIVARTTAEQRAFLTRWTGQLASQIPESYAELSAQTDYRISLYAKLLQQVYEETYGKLVQLVHAADVSKAVPAEDELLIQWHTQEDNRVCDRCEPRDQQWYTPETLPGYPGSGAFDGTLCRGGPNCRCWLLWVTVSKDSALADLAKSALSHVPSSSNVPAVRDRSHLDDDRTTPHRTSGRGSPPADDEEQDEDDSDEEEIR